MGANSQYIIAGWLIDGSGEPMKKNMLLEIKDGLIAAIAPYKPGDRPEPQVTTDHSRCCILPPMIDSHVHLCMSGTLDESNRKKQLAAGYEAAKEAISAHLIHQFSHGVLAVRDGGDRLASVSQFRKENREQQLPVTVKTPGRAWYREGRYGGLIGQSISTSTSLDKYIADQVLGDHIKIVHSGINSLTSFGQRTEPQFTTKELAETVRFATQSGVRVMVHANGEKPVRQAVEAGCHSIEHGFFMGDDNLRLMADKGTYWVPTVYTMKGCLEGIELGMKNAVSSVVSRTLDHQLQQLSTAREYGVRVAVGTDAGSIGVLHGEAMINELKMFMQAGYSLAEAIGCACQHGAHLVEVEKTYGVIAKGKPANFLVARGAPAQLPRKLRLLEAIYLNGKPSDEYRSLLKKARIHKI